MYSLASASILAIDLARHPNGAVVADVIDRVLVLTAAELERMTRPATHEARSWALACPGDDTLCGGLEGLHRLVGDVVQHASPAAQQVCLDAVTAAWSAPWAPASAVQDLQAPWEAAIDGLPAVLPATSYRAELAELLEDVVRRTPQQWESVTKAHARQRGTLRWSTLMHVSCRAAVEAGRDREVARAQLAAARAMATTEVGTESAMAVTASVQALCTRDLVDAAPLAEAWLAGS